MVRRLGPGVPLRRRWRSSIPTSPRSSWCCCCASGTCTRTASCRPTSGTSATSTRRCTPGRRIRVFKIDRAGGDGDIDFLERVFQKLLLNFTWWVNRKDADGNNVFEGGFLGLDNIGVFDRSAPLPTGGYLEQADGTAWMALFCQNMLEIALELAQARPRSTRTSRLKFFEHFSLDRRARWTIRRRPTACGTRRTASSTTCCAPAGRAAEPLKVRSMVGLLPLCAVDGPRAGACSRAARRSPSACAGSSSTARTSPALIGRARNGPVGRAPAAVARR